MPWVYEQTKKKFDGPIFGGGGRGRGSYSGATNGKNDV